MSDSPPLLDRLGRAIVAPPRGVLGLVDELLAASREHDLRITWQAGRCQVQFAGGDPAGRVEVPLEKSVVRAVLARVAVLCNERRPGSVSPYGGRGEVSIDAEPPGAIRATFVNTPEEQSLELISIQTAGPTGLQQALGAMPAR